MELYGKPGSSTTKYQWVELSKEKLENVFAQYLTDDGIQAKWVNSLIFTRANRLQKIIRALHSLLNSELQTELLPMMM